LVKILVVLSPAAAAAVSPVLTPGHHLLLLLLQALSCAAIDDVLAWCVLALASSFAKSGSALLGLYTTLLAAAYVLFMVIILRPLLALLHRALVRRQLQGSPYYTVFVFLLLLGSAFTTEGLGIHCFFGGFMMGLIVPKDDGFAGWCRFCTGLIVQTCVSL
jgi:Kef-type K+ transport system membrane component KefB